MIDGKKLYKWIKAQINPYGKPFEGTVFEFGNKVMDYIKAMEKQPQADKWIPVEVDMPKEMEEVLISRENSKTGTSVGYYNNVFGWYDQCLLRGVTDVVAWMPKPIEYKKEGNSNENT